MNIQEMRKTIGVIVNAVDENYQIEICSGMRKGAEVHDANLVFFSGLALKVPDKEDGERNAIYHMIQTNRLDGLIVVSGTLEIFVGMDSIEEFVKSFNDVPIVSMSIPFNWTYNILMDNKESIGKVFNHLIDVHNYRRIAYISGPLSNQEAMHRMQAYLACLKKIKSPYKDEMVYEGDFSHGSGQRGVVDILENCDELPEVIVAANDHMAIGALMELEKRGYRVPEDIAIAGFDDVESARVCYPPLTTVAQPLQQMGLKAMDIVCDVIDGKEVPINTYVNGEFVVRESCGCFQVNNEPLNLHSKSINENDLSYDDAYALTESRVLAKKQEIFTYILDKFMDHPSSCLEIEGYYDRLIDDLLYDLKSKTVEGRTVKGLNYILRYSFSMKYVEVDWYEILTRVRNQISKCINHYLLNEIFNGICFASLILVGYVLSNEEKSTRVRFEYLYMESREVLKNLNMSSSRVQLKSAIIDVMKQFGIEQYYVCLYKEPVISQIDKILALPETVTIAVGYGQSQWIYEKEFDLVKMLPDDYLYGQGRQDLIFFSLCAKKEHYGYIVFDMKNSDVRSFETIREQISYTLKRLLLNEQRTKAERNLNQAIKELEKYNNILHHQSIRDKLTDLLNRRGFYEEAEAFYDKAKSEKITYSVIFCDLDGLKMINDQYGHHEGDFAINKISDILRRTCHEHDIVGRMGGDEFTIICTNSEERDYKLLIRNIEKEIRQFNKKGIKEYKLSLSIGSVVVDPLNTLPLEALMSKADKVLYDEKSKKKQQAPFNLNNNNRTDSNKTK